MTWIDLLIARLRPYRAALLAVFDGAAWLFALTVFTVVRLGDDGRTPAVADLVVLAVVAGSLQFMLGGVVRLHHGRTNLGSLEEMTSLAAVAVTVGALVVVVNRFALDSALPLSVPVAATFLALSVSIWCRAGLRHLRLRTRQWRPDEQSRPVLIIGAGEGGHELVRSMLRDPTRAWRPVGLLDDDLQLRHRRFHGVPVLGTLAELGPIASRTGCQTVVIAIPSASRQLIKRIGKQALGFGLDLKVVPGVSDLPDGRVGVGDVRDIDVTDLLGRHQVDTDVASIGHHLRGKRVLVTGAGGSIGSELCRQIKTFEPAELIMLDRDESALHAVQLSITGTASLDAPDVVLADIRDARWITELFMARRPDVVFHAAALKHLTMLQQYPAEAVKTNVWGTLAVLDAARASGVKQFVNISTDKAANPCSVLGYTKRLAEGLTAAAAASADGDYLSVRFGNVLGSRGSVLTTFASQIAAGGPVTVTDPAVTRYFMTVQEAVQLVIQASVIGHDGEALVLDMGEPVRIADVAKQLVEWSESEVEIIYTGLHHGEKLFEELFGNGEPDVRPSHPLISHVPVPAVSIGALKINLLDEPANIINDLRRSCDGMTGQLVRGAA